METIRAKYDGQVLVLTLNRPGKKNALTQAMYLTLALALEDAGANEDVRAVVLQGSGTLFSSGNDIQDFARDGGNGGNGSDGGAGENASARFMEAVVRLDKPLVSAVCGHAVGIGATVLLHCDYVVASEDACIRFPFIDLGLCPEFGSTMLLPLVVGQHKAAEWMLLGTPVLAGEAHKAGLVNRVLPNDMVIEEALSIAKRLAAKPPAALAATRRLLRQTQREQVRSRIAEERDIFRVLRDTPDAQRVFRDFLTKQR